MALADRLGAIGRTGFDAIVADPRAALLVFDYDGTLAPIVDDPATAVPLPGVVDALLGLSRAVAQVAVVTGRPVETALHLLGLEGRAGLDGVQILGQYGAQRWRGSTGQLSGGTPPPGLADAMASLDGVLATAGVHDALVERKGLAVAVHVRRSADPQAAFIAIVEPLQRLADQHGLRAEPGRFVVELRGGGVDKGSAVSELLDETGARSILVAGDDLGDLAAFDVVERWRAARGAGLLVCSGSDEVQALARRADLVVDGPAGVLALMAELATQLAG